MPVTMIVIIPIFAWLANFVYMDLGSTMFSVPWEFNANMRNSNVLPNWVLLYSLVTLPFGQVLQRVLKVFSFRKRLKNLETGGARRRPKAGAHEDSDRRTTWQRQDHRMRPRRPEDGVRGSCSSGSSSGRWRPRGKVDLAVFGRMAEEDETIDRELDKRMVAIAKSRRRTSSSRGGCPACC